MKCSDCGERDVVSRGMCYACYRRWRRRDPVTGAREREQARAYKARNHKRVRAYNAAYNRDPANRARCSECGDLMGIGLTPGTSGLAAEPRCQDCRSNARAKTGLQIEAWWAEGLTLAEMARRLGWTRGHLNNQLDRLRADGYDLPYRHRHHKNAPKFPEQAA